MAERLLRLHARACACLRAPPYPVFQEGPRMSPLPRPPCGPTILLASLPWTSPPPEGACPPSPSLGLLPRMSPLPRPHRGPTILLASLPWISPLPRPRRGPTMILAPLPRTSPLPRPPRGSRPRPSAPLLTALGETPCPGATGPPCPVFQEGGRLYGPRDLCEAWLRCLPPHTSGSTVPVRGLAGRK